MLADEAEGRTIMASKKSRTFKKTIPIISGLGWVVYTESVNALLVLTSLLRNFVYSFVSKCSFKPSEKRGNIDHTKLLYTNGW